MKSSGRDCRRRGKTLKTQHSEVWSSFSRTSGTFSSPTCLLWTLTRWITSAMWLMRSLKNCVWDGAEGLPRHHIHLLHYTFRYFIQISMGFEKKFYIPPCMYICIDFILVQKKCRTHLTTIASLTKWNVNNHSSTSMNVKGHRLWSFQIIKIHFIMFFLMYSFKYIFLFALLCDRCSLAHYHPLNTINLSVCFWMTQTVTANYCLINLPLNQLVLVSLIGDHEKTASAC